jgi:Rrf2 family protein
MLGLSETCGYAILALACLDQCQGNLVLARQIAKVTNIPLPYLAKILHALTKSGLVTSKRGYHGGFRLTRPAEQVTLLDVINAVDGHAIPECLLGFSQCDIAIPCPTHTFWEVERARIMAELQRLTLREVAEFERARQPGLQAVCCSHAPQQPQKAPRAACAPRRVVVPAPRRHLR